MKPAPGRPAPKERDKAKEREAAKPAFSRRIWLMFLAILLVNFVLMRFFVPDPNAPITVPYTAFKQEVAKGNVEAIYSQGESIEGRFAEPVTWPPADAKPQAAPRARILLPTASHRGREHLHDHPARVRRPGLEAFLIEHGVEISAVPIQDEQPLDHAALRLRPGDPDHRLLRLDVPARGAGQGGMGGR